MVQNAVMQALREADDLKQKLFQGNEDVVVSTNKTILLTQLQKAYQKVLLIDLDYALDKKVEQDLWNYGFKNQIESLQKSTKDKKNTRRAETQLLLNWSIQAATGFYLSLLHEICSTFKLNLPFRCNIPMIMDVEPVWKISKPPQASSCWYICQYCLVHLGDLARYTRQPQMASSFYKQALSVSQNNGQPYNQLGLLRATRGDKLGAAYYHARGLAVGGPFPPAHNNLTRTLAQANSITDNCSTDTEAANSLDSSTTSSYARLNPNIFLAQYMSVHHHIITSEDFDKANKISKGISSTLTALVATQQFNSDTLLQICCLSMYSIYSLTEGHTLSLETPLAEEEQCWLDLSINILAGTMEALLLPIHTMSQSQITTYSALPATKIILEWLKLHPDMLKHSAFVSRPQLWPGLCVLLSSLQETIKDSNGDLYATVPLPEDEELRGYLPIDRAFVNLKFANTVSSELYGKSIVEIKNVLPSDENEEISEKEIISKKKIVDLSVVDQENLKKDKNYVDVLRSFRLIQLGKWLVQYQKENGQEFISMHIENDLTTFTPMQNSVENDPDLVKTIKELSILREKKLSESFDQEKSEDTSDNESKSVITDNCKEVTSPNINTATTSGDTSPRVEVKTPPPPVIISEADFREKVREKKAGILKPQGSLERARLEKAALVRATARDSPGDLPDSQDNQDTGSSCSTVSQDGNICSDVGSLLEPSVPKEKGKKTRTNVALQAILKKQEESNKQVKFLTPVTTPDSISEPTPQLSPQTSKEFDKKIIQPKIIKSLFSFSTDRKTGGILSLKDKSGYPHLQNVENIGDAKVASLETTNESNIKREPGDTSGECVVSPNKHKKDKGNSAQTSAEKSTPFHHGAWSGDSNHDKSPSARLQSQSHFSYFSPPGSTQNMSITLPVVNPKEIDVRSAALHKQKNVYGVGEGYMSPDVSTANSSMYSYWGGQSNVSIPQSAHKNYPKNSPRGANVKWSSNEYPQTRAPDMQFSDMGQQGMFNHQGPQNTWWKLPSQEHHYDGGYNMPYQQAPNYLPTTLNSPNFHQPSNPSIQNNFSKMSYNPPVASDGQQFGHPGYPNSQFLPQSSNFSPMPAYNPAMYPQFTNRFNYPSSAGTEYNMNTYGYETQNQMRPAMNQPIGDSSLDIRGPAYHQGSSQKPIQFNLGFDEKNSSSTNMEGNNKQQSGNTYSLFSGSCANAETPWPMVPSTKQTTQPSLWSGPGPSPLERLLEQQKQFRFTPNE